jgi:PadR family transcriptional regulator PadR
MPRLIEPMLLYLLCDGQAHHGYELMEMARAEAITDSEIDPGGTYRALRRLEEAGCTESRWQPGQGGPRKRLYAITPLGRKHLEDWVTVIGRCGQSMVEFAERCRQRQLAPKTDD